MSQKPKQEADSEGKAKHVVFLGAGASKTSGYPLADELRLLIASPESLRSRVKDLSGPHFDGLDSLLAKWLDVLKQPIRLFREGGFSTVDEFVRLTESRFGAEGNYLRRLLSLCLAIHNPEQNFERSDYYPFIQRLFDANDLANLRSDVAVMTFNYDPYLEFLLHRAYTTRCEAAGRDPDDVVKDAILSGFAFRNIQQLENSKNFCLLKLHGSTALPKRGARGLHCPTHDELFGMAPEVRFKAILNREFMQLGYSPVYFPWEIITPKGRFVRGDKFRFGNDIEQRHQIGGYAGPVSLYDLFTSVWKRARKEVQRASKISFVGLSIHEYLRPGFKFLFEGKSNPIELVVADASLQSFGSGRESDAHFNPLTPVSRLDQLLREICPDLRWNEDGSAPEGCPSSPDMISGLSRRPIRIHSSFKDFISNELRIEPEYQGVIRTSVY